MKQKHKRAPTAGKKRVVIHSHGKKILWQDFFYPDGKKERFLFWDSDTYPSVIFPLTKDGNVVYLSQFRHGANRFVIELPGGGGAKRSPSRNARQELLEETGYEAEKLVPLAARGVWFEPANIVASYFPFFAIGCIKTKGELPDTTEIIRVKETSLEQWINMIRRGAIKDSKTIATTFLAILFLHGA